MLHNKRITSYDNFCFEDSRCEDFSKVYPDVSSLVGTMFQL